MPPTCGHWVAVFTYGAGSQEAVAVGEGELGMKVLLEDGTWHTDIRFKSVQLN